MTMETPTYRPSPLGKKSFRWMILWSHGEDEATKRIRQAAFDSHNQKMLKEVGEQLVLVAKTRRGVVTLLFFFGIILLRTIKILLWGISEYDFFWKIYPFMSCRRVHFSIWPWWWIFGCFWYTVYIINLNFCRFYFGYDWNGTMVGTKGMFNREGQLLRNMIADMPLTRLVYGYIGGCLK